MNFLRARSRAFVLAGAATVALGVGANLAVLTVMRGLWAENSGISEPTAVATVYFKPNLGVDGALTSTGGRPATTEISNLQTADAAFEVVATDALRKWMAPRIRLREGAALASTAVTHRYFDVATVAVTGPGFVPADDYTDRHVAVVSAGLASRLFGSPEQAVGRHLETLPVPLLIVGVTAAHFSGVRLGDEWDVWVPLGAMASVSVVPADAMTSLPLAPLLRVRGGSTWRAVQDEVERVSRGRAVAFRLSDVRYAPSGLGAMARQRDLLVALQTIAVLVLSAAALNISSLLLIRLQAERRNAAIRMALGGSLRQALSPVMIEALVVISAGAALSVATSTAVLRSIESLSLPAGVPIKALIPAPDWSVAGLAFLLAAVVVAAGALAIARGMRTSPANLISRESAGGNARTSRQRHWMVGVHVGAAFVILAVAVALVGRVGNLLLRDQGADIEGLFLATVTPSTDGYLAVSDEGAGRVVNDFQAAMLAVRELPGVSLATFGDAPIAREGSVLPVRFKTNAHQFDLRAVVVRGGSDYVRAIGGRLVAGHDLTASDLGGAVSARQAPQSAPGRIRGVVITEGLARALWSSSNPIGESLTVNGTRAEVVGVISDVLGGLPGRVRAGTIVVGTEPSGWLGATLPAILARRQASSRVNEKDISRAVAGAFVRGADINVETFRRRVTLATSNEQLGARLFGSFGVMSCAIAVLGVYGMASSYFASRRRELAIRAALGAPSAHLIWATTRTLFHAVSVGIAAGFGFALLLFRLPVATSLGLESIQWPYAAALGIGMLATAFTATRIAAREAGRLDLSRILNDGSR